MAIYLLLAVAALALFVVAGTMIARTHFSTRRKILERMLQEKDTHQPDTVPRHLRMRAAATEVLARLPVFASTQRIDVGRKLIAAGYRGASAMAVLVAITLLSALICLALASLWLWSSESSFHWTVRLPGMLLAVWLGMLLPRLVLERLVARRQRAVVRGLPDALDLMIICTNAGLGLNATLQRVATEMASISPAVADEFALTFAEAQLSGDTRMALRRMAERVDVPSIKSLVSTLSQAQRYGTPITQALRILVNSERRARLLGLEEKAGKLGTKITFPMMLFILPPVLMVSAGPAVLQLMDSMK